MSIIPKKNSLTPWTVAQFELYRPHMTEWVKSKITRLLENNECNRVVVRAPVKSGKREIVEYISMRDEGLASPRVNAFLSAWHRAADEDQRRELKLHNMKVFSINKKSAADECIKWINEQLKLGKIVVLHIDECDHGSGEKQILGRVYKHIREQPKVFTILYSATPQEVLFSRDVISEEEEELLDDMLYGMHVEYIPPNGYCGPGRFLDEGLITNALPFFTLNPVPALTDQGLEIIKGLLQNIALKTGRNIVTLRLTKKDGKKKDNKEIYKFLKNCHLIPELSGIQIWVDKGDCDWGKPRKIEWSDPEYWAAIAKDIPILIVMDQTSSRSTEWACHDRIFATHDYRTSMQYTILSQAQERVNHYDNRYDSGFQPIHVYGHKKTFELSSGRINYEKYFACEWNMRKVDIRRAIKDKLGEVYEIKNEAGVLHPLYTQPLAKEKAENILKELGCFGDISLSTRVIGKPRQLPIFDTHWFQCSAESWDIQINIIKQSIQNSIIRAHNFENPFRNTHRPPMIDGKEVGYLRGWQVLDYDADIKTQPGWGVSINAPRITICYNNNILGAAIRWHTGTFNLSNRLNAYKSMYPEKMQYDHSP
jgi:hypothetical protein